MAEYPLLFRITHGVRCDKFEAVVCADGRALMFFEEQRWHCSGVDPGAVVETDADPLVAFERFRLSFRHLLDDLAEESESFEAFQRDAMMFFSTDPVEERRWNAALGAFRAGTEIEEPFRDMERMVRRPSKMEVKLLVSYAGQPLSMASDQETVALPSAA